ncbi:MAG TPA: cytochrome c [Xanthobacteraceae bacterium]|jgi:mono/diheme cytochrome c family protein
MVHRAFALVILLVGLSHEAAAAEDHLDAQQALGRRLYEQSCAVCHTRPTLVSGMYGPELSKNSAGGSEAAMREVITNGGPRMPAFKYTYDGTQIAAIASYLMTLSPGHEQTTPAQR